jgi:signal transduction histidine kinase
VWQNLAIALVVVPLVWSIRTYLPKSRTWAAILITACWGIGLLINFLFPGNLTFIEVQSIEQRMTPWGDAFFVPNGTINNWKWITDVTVILIPLYVIDAAWRDPDRHRGKRGAVMTVGIVLFVLFAGIQAILVDSGRLDAPYMISAAFLSIVLALTWVLARDAVRAKSLVLEVARAQRETERLMRANLLGEVAAALAHELNQPLAAILGNAQAAQKFLDRPDPNLTEVQDILADIVRDDKRARDIILNMRQMLTGDDSHQDSVDLEPAISEILDFVNNELNENDVTVLFDHTGDVPAVSGGRVALQQVILNLLLNAEHAVRESQSPSREIRIHLREHRGGVEVEVRDFGPGIAEDVRHRLFDPFVSTKEGSLGMGLAVCRRIVEGQGGRLTAENAEDGGALFRMWLPALTS